MSCCCCCKNREPTWFGMTTKDIGTLERIMETIEPELLRSIRRDSFDRPETYLPEVHYFGRKIGYFK